MDSLDPRKELQELQKTLKEIDKNRDRINNEISKLQEELQDANMNRQSILDRMREIEKENKKNRSSKRTNNNRNNNNNSSSSWTSPDEDPSLIEYRQPQDWDEKVTKSLRKIFKLSSFRPLQRAIINCTLSGHDCFVVMPSGGGKSLCYQLPATIKQPYTLEGVTVVISPLIALMVDQVYQLKKIGISLVRIMLILGIDLTKNGYLL